MKAVVKHHHSHRHRRLSLLLGGVAVVLALTVVVTWSWNTLVPDLASGPRIEFKHALALVALMACAGWLLRGGGWRRADDRSRHAHSR